MTATIEDLRQLYKQAIEQDNKKWDKLLLDTVVPWFQNNPLGSYETTDENLVRAAGRFGMYYRCTEDQRGDRKYMLYIGCPSWQPAATKAPTDK